MKGKRNLLREQWPRLTMGHLGSRTIASEILERVSCGDQTTLSVGLPRGAESHPRVCEDCKTNRTFFVTAVFGCLQSFQVVFWDNHRV